MQPPRRSRNAGAADGARGAAGQERELALGPNLLERVVEVLDLVQRADLGFVGEHDVDRVDDELAELVAMALDAEPVAQRERDLVARVPGDLHRFADRRLCGLHVPQVALAVRDARIRHAGWVDVVARDRSGYPK